MTKNNKRSKTKGKKNRQNLLENMRRQAQNTINVDSQIQLLDVIDQCMPGIDLIEQHNEDPKQLNTQSLSSLQMVANKQLNQQEQKSLNCIQEKVIAYIGLLRLQEANYWNTKLQNKKQYLFQKYQTEIKQLIIKSEVLQSLVKSQNYGQALKTIAQMNNISSNNLKIKYMKVQILIKKGLLIKAKKNMKNIALQDHAQTYYLNALVELYLGRVQQARKFITTGLKFETQTCKKCSQLLQTIQKSKQIKFNGIRLLKQQKYHQAIDKFSQALIIDRFNKKYNVMIYLLRAQAYLNLKLFGKALEDANQILRIQSNSVKALILRANIHEQMGLFSEAFLDYQKIKQIDPQMDLSQHIFQLKEKERKSKRKDYYEILGLNKDASQVDIKKVYKTLALKYHPDKNINKSQSEQKEASTKFTLITQAYGILKDSQKKLAYDNGQMNFQGDQGQQYGAQYEYFYDDEQVSMNSSQFMVQSNIPFGFMEFTANIFDYAGSFQCNFEHNFMTQQQGFIQIIDDSQQQRQQRQQRQYSRSRNKSQKKNRRQSRSRQKGNFRKDNFGQNNNRPRHRNFNNYQKNRKNKGKNNRFNHQNTY